MTSTELTLDNALKLEKELMVKIEEIQSKLDSIHCFGAMDLNRDILWKIRARVQDSARALYDLAPLRKDLKYV